MFGSQGWKDLIEDVTHILEKTNDIDPIFNGEQLQFKKGELSILKWILALEEMSRTAYDQLLAED